MSDWGTRVILTEARIFVVLPIRCRLGEIERYLMDAEAGAASSLLPTGSSEKHQEEKTWQERPLNVPNDLHATLASVLGYSGSRAKPVYWSLNPDLLKALNSRVDASERETSTAVANPDNFGLALRLNDAAVRRLGLDEQSRFLPVKISGVDFYLSQSRFGQMVVEIECAEGTTDQATVIEVAYALGHGPFAKSKAVNQRLFRLSYRGEPIVAQDLSKAEGTFTLSDLAHTLLCPKYSDTCFIHTPRNFTYTLAATTGDLDEGNQKELAARFGRRLNSAYSPRATMEGVEFAKPYDNIVHACSLDGGAALVTRCEENEVLRNFVQNQGSHIYLLLALLAHKDMHDLVALSQGTVITIEHDERGNEEKLSSKLERIEEVRERLLNYRLAHRFSFASFGVNHNLVHEAWRKAIRADELLADVTADVSQATDYLHAARDRIREKVMRDQTSWLKAVVAFLATIEGVHVLTAGIFEYLGYPSVQRKAAESLATALGTHLPPEEPLSRFELGLLAAPFVIASIVSVAVWYFSRRGEDVSGH